MVSCVVVVAVVVVSWLMVIQWQAYLEIKIMAVLLQKMDLVLAPNQVPSATLRCIHQCRRKIDTD